MANKLDEAQLLSVAEKLGRSLKGGEVIELIGDVGSGKTTFTKGLARGLGVEDNIQSPSFTISRVYDKARDGLRLAHYDFYRLSSAGVMRQELYETVHDSKTVTVIEWGDIVQDILPSNRLTVNISIVDDDHRSIKLNTIGDLKSRYGRDDDDIVD